MMTEVAALGLRVTGVTDIDSASSSLDRFTKSSKSADQASGGLASESRNTSKSLADVAREGDKSSASISKLAGAAKLAAGAFAGIKLTGLIKDVTMANSRFEQLGTVMGVVGRNAGLSQTQVARYAKEVQGMGISMTESRQTIIRMTQAQMDLSKASELARLAQDAAVIANTNSSDALNRLIYGLQSGQVEILRNMGLNVNFAASYSKLATEMGVTADQLSEVDKVQARTNAVMEAGIGIAGAYDASMENAGKQLGSTTRYLQDLGVMWGEVFSDAARDAIFGYSDALKGMHATTKQMREDGTLDRLADAIATISRGAVTGAKVLGAYAVAVYAIPAAKAAATVATTAYQAVLATFSAQVAMTTTQLLTMRTALNVLAAGFAGWQIGSYLRKEFEIVEKAGIALMGGLHTMAIQVGGYFKRLGQSVLFALTNPLDAFRNKLADLLQSLSALGQGALRMLGLDVFADAIGSGIEAIRSKTGEEHRAMLEQMKVDTQREADAVSDIYADMFANVGKSAGANLKVVGKGLDDVLDRLGGFNDALEETGGNTGGIKKVDTAFQSLMDTLFPAEAAQRKYNAELAILAKHLRGNQLAKAVSELTKQFTGGDADGAAKAIKEYNKNLKTLVDRLNPAAVAARTFKDEQKLLTDAIKRTGDPTGELARSLEELERQYSETSRVTNEWTKWTESALDRVDGAFANAWRNIGDGFSSFRDNLTNAFKQMLAELAHLAITRPIVLQIGAAMGIGGAAAQLSSMGGGGGFDLIGMLGRGVSLSQSGFGQAVLSGWQSGEGVLGGLQGAFGSGSSYVSGLFGGGAATGAGTGYGLGQPLVAGELGAASYAAPGMQTWGGAATSLGAILGGLGGAYMGWQQNGLEGAVGTGLASWGGGTLGGMGGAALGQAIGGTIGSVLPGIGTAIGVALGGLLGGSLFGGSGERFKRTVGSATGYYGDDGYVSTGPSATWHPGSRKFGAEHDAVLDDLNSAFVTTIGSLFDAFGVDSTIATTTRTRLRRTSGRMVGDFITEIDGQITNHFRQYSKDGKIGEAMEQFADDIMGEYLAKSIVGSDLPEYFRQQFKSLAADSKVTAEQVAETLTEIFTRFDGVNAILEVTGHAAYELTNAGMRASDAIIALSGGLDALQASTAVYYDQFFTVAEKQADTIAAVEKAFAAADITLAGSREGYRAMVESIDMTTEAGQSMFATMMALAGQADQYYSILEQTAGAMFGAAMGEVSAAFSALQRSTANEQQKVQSAYNDRIGELNSLLSASASRIGDIGRISGMLNSALKRLRGTSDDATRSLRAQAVMTLNSALVSARSGRSLAGFDGLQDALDVASQMDTKLYSSLVDFEREQGRTANLIAELEKVNGKQLTTEEKMLAALENQIVAAQAQYELEMAGLNAQLEAAQRQIDALNGVDNSVMSLAQALDRMSSAVKAAQAAQAAQAARADADKTAVQAAAAKSAVQSPAEVLDQLYQDVVGREGDASGRNYWLGKLDSGALSLGELGATMAHSVLSNENAAASDRSNANKYLGLQSFSGGGIASGPMSGYPVELHGTEAVIPLNGSRIPLNVPGIQALVREVSELRKELAASQRAIAENTGKSSRVLEREEMERRQEEVA